MSLHPWEWEDDQASLGAVPSTVNFYQSMSECEVEEYLKAKARAQESESDPLLSSLGSSDWPPITFASDVPQVVPCKFIISLAIPSFAAVQKGKHLTLIDKFKRSKADRALIKSRRFYHIEYSLLPDDGEPKKADVVVFPTVAKVFQDSAVKTVKLWLEGDKVWLAWTQTFHINMTKELLKKMSFYKITLRLWDTKDKVPRKVRYYRLKTPGYSDDTGSFEEVKNLVLSQRKLPKQDIHITRKWDQESVPGKAEKTEQVKALQEPDIFPTDLEDEKLFRMEDPGFLQWSISRKMNSSPGLTGMEKKEPSISSLNITEKQKIPIRVKELEGKKKTPKKNRSVIEEGTNSKLLGHWRPETFSMQLAVMPLLAGWQTVVSHGSLRSANILDCFLTLKTEVPIMTEEQKQDLNPLIIKIHSVSCLPSQPVPIHELEVRSRRALGSERLPQPGARVPSLTARARREPRRTPPRGHGEAWKTSVPGLGPRSQQLFVEAVPGVLVTVGGPRDPIPEPSARPFQILLVSACNEVQGFKTLALAGKEQEVCL